MYVVYFLIDEQVCVCVQGGEMLRDAFFGPSFLIEVAIEFDPCNSI